MALTSLSLAARPRPTRRWPGCCGRSNVRSMASGLSACPVTAFAPNCPRKYRRCAMPRGKLTFRERCRRLRPWSKAGSANIRINGGGCIAAGADGPSLILRSLTQKATNEIRLYRKVRHARPCATAVRFDFCGQGAWRGFFCVLSASHTFETPKEVRAMRHQNSVFHSLTKHIPWTRFDQIVEKYGADEFARKLTTKRQFIALLYGQLSGSTSLREVVTGMGSHETRLYHVGATPVKPSTMSDANSKRPWQVFSELFAQMLPQAHRGLRRTTADAVRLIDSTRVRLSILS